MTSERQEDLMPYDVAPASRLSGNALNVAYVLIGILALLILMIPVGWWSEATPTLRSFLEGIPLGDAVAERRAEEGNPVLVGVVFTVLVAAAILATTLWRRRAAHNYVYGGVTFIHLYAVSVIRTLVIFGGLSLIPNVVAIAHGMDLREEPEQTFTGPVWVVVILVAWLAYSYFGLERLLEREARSPSRAAAR